MTSSELATGCERWQLGDNTKHPPIDKAFLEAITQAGFIAFTGPSGLCGGKSENRTVVIVHRSRGTKWEVVFRESDLDILTTTTTDLGSTTTAVLSWLRGGVLAAEENSVHSVAG